LIFPSPERKNCSVYYGIGNVRIIEKSGIGKAFWKGGCYFLSRTQRPNLNWSSLSCLKGRYYRVSHSHSQIPLTNMRLLIVPSYNSTCSSIDLMFIVSFTLSRKSCHKWDFKEISYIHDSTRPWLQRKWDSYM
jgi:hypothetical protein